MCKYSRRCDAAAPYLLFPCAEVEVMVCAMFGAWLPCLWCIFASLDAGLFDGAISNHQQYLVAACNNFKKRTRNAATVALPTAQQAVFACWNEQLTLQCDGSAVLLSIASRHCDTNDVSVRSVAVAPTTLLYGSPPGLLDALRYPGARCVPMTLEPSCVLHCVSWACVLASSFCRGRQVLGSVKYTLFPRNFGSCAPEWIPLFQSNGSVLFGCEVLVTVTCSTVANNRVVFPIDPEVPSPNTIAKVTGRASVLSNLFTMCEGCRLGRSGVYTVRGDVAASCHFGALSHQARVRARSNLPNCFFCVVILRVFGIFCLRDLGTFSPEYRC